MCVCVCVCVCVCMYVCMYIGIVVYSCRVTVCRPNPKELGYKLNEPNTINL